MQPAIHFHLGAGDVAAGVAAKEIDRFGGLVRLAEVDGGEEVRVEHFVSVTQIGRRGQQTLARLGHGANGLIGIGEVDLLITLHAARSEAVLLARMALTADDLAPMAGERSHGGVADVSSVAGQKARFVAMSWLTCGWFLRRCRRGVIPQSDGFVAVDVGFGTAVGCLGAKIGSVGT